MSHNSRVSLKHIFVFIFSLILTVSSARAEIFKDHVFKSATDGFDFNGSLILGIGILAASYAQANNWDEKMKDSWGSNQRWSHDQTQLGNYLGMGIAGIAITTGQLFLDTENGYAHGEALIYTFATTSVLKYLNNRPRPNGLNRYSMPSGHTSTTFATATSLAYSYGVFAAIPAYILATYTGLTRISDDAHWLSDTVIGASLGVFWGRATSFHHGGGGGGSASFKYRIDPWYTEGAGGLVATGNF